MQVTINVSPRIGGLLVLVLLAVGMLVVVACNGEDGGSENREKSVEYREQILREAEKVAPLPHPKNFPIRRALVKFTERQDLLDHNWYVYVGMENSYTGYYVSQTYPINVCNFLSSTEKVWEGDGDTALKLTAPSLDGIFYGGAGATAGCDAWFFFDAETDAMQTFHAPFWQASDKPLVLKEPVQRIRVVP